MQTAHNIKSIKGVELFYKIIKLIRKIMHKTIKHPEHNIIRPCLDHSGILIVL